MGGTMEIADAARSALDAGEKAVTRAIDELRPRAEPTPLPAPAADVWSPDQLVSLIAESARRNHWASAGFALIELRKWHEAADQTMFGTWSEFTSKRLPSIAPADIDQLIGKVLFRGGALQCSACGAQAVCRCGCGAPYVVEHPWAAPAPVPASALDRAIAAIQSAPEKSDRAIAAEIGVGHQTVGRARRHMQTAGAVGPPLDHRERNL